MSANHRSDFLILGLLIGLVAVVLAVLAASGLLSKQEQEQPILRTSHSTNIEGTMAGYVLLERLGLAVHREESPLLAETLAKTDVLLIIEPLLTLESDERRAVKEWLRGGGVLICTPDVEQRLQAPRRESEDGEEGQPAERRRHKHIVRSAPYTEASAEHETVVPATVPQPLARDVTRVSCESRNTLDPAQPEPRGKALFTDSDGVRIVSRPCGRGLIVSLADTSFLANCRIGKSDNAVLAVNLVRYALSQARGSRVAFDEYHFGYGTRETGMGVLASALVRSSAGWAVLALTAAGLAYLFYRGRRFGTRRDAPRPRRRTKVEYVTSVAAVYQAAGAHRLVLELVWHWFKRRAAALVGLPASIGCLPLSERLAWRTGGSAQKYGETLTACEQAVEQSRLPASRVAVLLRSLAK